MGRAAIAVVAGIVVAFVAVLAIELLGLAVFPQPAGMNPTDPASVRAHFADIPFGSFATVIVAWTIAAFLGPFVAGRLAVHAPRRWPSLVVISLFALLCGYNLMVVPTPRWMIPVAVMAVTVASLLGYRSSHRVPA